MIKKISVFAVTIVVAAGLSFGSTAFADEASPAMDVSSWTKVSDGDLASLRAGDSTTIQNQEITQGGDQTSDCSGGCSNTINFGESTFANSSMSMNTFNTGNNVKMSNQMIITVNIYD